jgi:hypothetical protein
MSDLSSFRDDVMRSLGNIEAKLEGLPQRVSALERARAQALGYAAGVSAVVAIVVMVARELW